MAAVFASVGVVGTAGADGLSGPPKIEVAALTTLAAAATPANICVAVRAAAASKLQIPCVGRSCVGKPKTSEIRLDSLITVFLS